MQTKEELCWILNRIKTVEDRFKKSNNPGWWSTHRNIWQGCYDVWFDEQDKIDSIEIPNNRMKEAENLGLIVSQEKTYPNTTYKTIIWEITESGEKMLFEQNMTDISISN